MLKRSLPVVLVLAMSLSACATVSVLPGTAVVETPVSEEQSTLRNASTAFGETAVSRGWVTQTRGMFDLARVLVDGQDAEEDTPGQTYAELIGVNVRSAEDVAVTVSTDAKDAAAALSNVSSAATEFLAADSETRQTTSRSDLVSFERALVQAQQTRRVFAEAITVADIVDVDMVNTALALFDKEIDAAREIADALAVEYSSRDYFGGAVS